MAATVYLERANTDLVCHCRCPHSLISSPGQMDCPWCGCGWLFTCMKCHKAYAFARGIEVAQTLEELAYLDWQGKSNTVPTREEIDDWVESMRILLKEVRPGQTYVYLDGWYVPIDLKPVRLEGWHSMHDLPVVPHVEALTNRRALDEVLASQVYWQTRAVPGQP